MNNDTSFINSLVDGHQHEKLANTNDVGENIETNNQIKAGETIGIPNQTELVGGVETITGIGSYNQEMMRNTAEEMGGAEKHKEAQEDPEDSIDTIGGTETKTKTSADNKQTLKTTVTTTPVSDASDPKHIAHDKNEETFINEVVKDQMEEEAARESR
jgi:hypothetical protein